MATGPVAVPTPAALGAEATAACAALLAALPAEIDPGVARRPTTGATAAWGDPPVTLACGVAPGDPDDPPVEVNGLAWAVHDIGAGNSWTTTTLGINVVVEIPDRYANGAELVNPLAAPILATLPRTPSPAPGG